MKNKKGFTLMELLAIVALLGLIALAATIGIINMSNNQKQKDYQDIVKTIISASRTYVGLNKNNSKNDLIDTNSIEIPLSSLIESNLLKSDLIDPRTDEKISHNNKVKVEYNPDSGEFTYTYNYD